MEEPAPSPIIRDVPWGMWFVGTFVCGVAVIMAPMPPWRAGPILGFIALCVIQVLVFTLSSMLSIQIEADSNCLVLTYLSLLKRRVKTIPLDEIASIDIQVSESERRSSRVVITQRDGQMIPLRPYYSTTNKERIVGRLRHLIGVGGSHTQLTEELRELRQQHQALIAPYAETTETDGVSWKIEGIELGHLPVTRWFSDDITTNGEFVYIVQKPAGQPFPGGMIGRMAMRTSLSFYGFKDEYAPRSNEARLVPLDSELSSHFMAFASDESIALEILNPTTREALASWAARHPVKTVSVGYSLGQLTVLFSPRGVYVSAYSICDTAVLQDFIAIGVQLVQAQAKARL